MRLSLFFALLFAGLVQAAEPIAIDVHRDANCGCCKDWIKHLEDNGFTVNDHVEADMTAVKQRLGVPPRLASCHTGVIDGQFVEGHVPAADILKLRQRPELLGAAVPGMPVGSPGMDGPAYGGHRDAYAVLLVQRDGRSTVFEQYR